LKHWKDRRGDAGPPDLITDHYEPISGREELRMYLARWTHTSHPDSWEPASSLPPCVINDYKRHLNENPGQRERIDDEERQDTQQGTIPSRRPGLTGERAAAARNAPPIPAQSFRDDPISGSKS